LREECFDCVDREGLGEVEALPEPAVQALQRAGLLG
jgi:hypothetical protein